MSWWIHELYANRGAAALVSWVFWVFFSIILHELSHGWAAIWQGDDTPRALGHMTWNPLVHIPPVSLVMFIVVGITWGLMPVNPSNFKSRRRGRVIVSAAGPAMNIVLFFVATLALVTWLRTAPNLGVSPDVFQNFATFFEFGAMLNIVLAILNLMPVPPLDGSNILSGLSMQWYQWMQDPRVRQVGFFALLIIFISPIGGAFWMVGMEATIGTMRAIEFVLP